MTQAGLEPNGETFKALLCGYAKQGLHQDITSTLSNNISGFILGENYILHDFYR